jgi:phosphoribosyl 1,2-cyclic phosphodiesterase
MKVKFWGVRGSVATPGQDTVRYGGNTACLEVSDDKHLVILDAGTGIRPLGLDLIKRYPQGTKISGHLFITHFHVDHIQGFPFFNPFYAPSNHFTIYGCEGAGKKLESIFMGQLSPEYFPVTLKEMPAELKFVQLTTRPVQLDGWTISPTYVNHPGLALGYRLDSGTRRVSYITDNEPFRYLLRQQGGQSDIFDDLNRGVVELEREDKNLVEFVRGSDVLIHDAMYTIDEYKTKLSWGHSFVEFALEVALQAEVRQLVLFHHDPMRSDVMVDDLLKHVRSLAAKRNPKLQIHAAQEGFEIPLT